MLLFIKKALFHSYADDHTLPAYSSDLNSLYWGAYWRVSNHHKGSLRKWYENNPKIISSNVCIKDENHHTWGFKHMHWSHKHETTEFSKTFRGLPWIMSLMSLMSLIAENVARRKYRLNKDCTEVCASYAIFSWHCSLFFIFARFFKYATFLRISFFCPTFFRLRTLK